MPTATRRAPSTIGIVATASAMTMLSRQTAIASRPISRKSSALRISSTSSQKESRFARLFSDMDSSRPK